MAAARGGAADFPGEGGGEFLGARTQLPNRPVRPSQVLEFVAGKPVGLLVVVAGYPLQRGQAAFAECTHRAQQRFPIGCGALQEQRCQFLRCACPARGLQYGFGGCGRTHPGAAHRGVVGGCAECGEPCRRRLDDVCIVEQRFEQVAVVHPCERGAAYTGVGIAARAVGDFGAKFFCLFGRQRLDGAEPFVSAG